MAGVMPDGGLFLEYRIAEFSGWPVTGMTGPRSLMGGWITDPVVVGGGKLVFSSSDLFWEHDGTYVGAERLYRHDTANPSGVADFGPCFHTNLRIVVDESTDGLTATVDLGNGEDMAFTRPTTDDPFTAPAGWERYQVTKVDGVQYKLTDKNGYTYTFLGSANPTRLINTRNRYGSGEDYSYDASGYVTHIGRYADGTGHVDDIHVLRDTAHAITSIYDYAGRTVNYSYDASSRLTKVEDACGSCSTLPTAEYAYDGSDRITAIKDADGSTIRTIGYDGSNRVSYDIDAAGGTFHFEYGTPDLVIDPEGNTSEYTFDGSGNLVTKNFTMGAGAGDDILYIYQYDSSRRVTSATLPSGAVVSYAYDSRGNALSQVVTADGRSITTFTASYESTYNRPLTITDALGDSKTCQYDANGNLTTLIVGLSGPTSSYSYNTKGLMTYKTSAAGRAMSYSYDTAGFVTTAVADPNGLALSAGYTRDDLGHALTTTSPEGHHVVHEYDKSGKVTQNTSAQGIVTQYEYDANARQTARKIMDGQTALYIWQTEYNTAGQVTKTITPDNSETTYAYDKAGRQSKQDEPNGRVSESVYDQVGRVITTKRGNAGGTVVVQSKIYDKMGNVVTTQDGDGHQTIYQYDGFGRQTKVIDPSGAYAAYDYDDASHQTGVRRYDSADTLMTYGKTEYDELGRVTKTRQKASPAGADGSSDAVTESQYDGDGRLVTQIVWYDASNANTSTYAYDGAGRQTAITNPDGLVTTYGFDGDSHRTSAIDANSNTTSYAYDADGRQVTVTNALGDYTVTEYDQRGLQTQVSQYASGGVIQAQSKYEYDIAGKQTLSRRMADPGGSIDNSKDYVVKTYYDAAGVQTQQTSASGQDTTYAYDQYGRQTLTTLPDGSYTASEYTVGGNRTKQVQYEIVTGSTKSYRQDYTYDVLDRAVTTHNQGPDGTFGNNDDLFVQYVYDALGRQVTTTDEAGKLAVNDYDALGRKTKGTEDAAGIARVTEYAYDRVGRLVTLAAYTDSPATGQENTVYQYNGRGLQTIVTYEETGNVTMAYDAAGNMTARTDEEGIVVDYAYDSVNRLTLRQKDGSSDNVERYAYDSLGRMITAQKGTSGNADAVSMSVFGYDALSRVTQESQAIAEGTAKAIDYTYDKAGNRMTLQHDNAAITSAYAYDSRDRCTGIDTYNGSAWVDLADYTWLGGAVSKREVTCDYPGGTKPKFKTDFQRDGILRVTKVENAHLTANQSDSGYGDLGTFEYTYDSASNVLTANQAGSMGYLDADRWYTYDTLNRVITAKYSDNQGWLATQSPTSWYSYDDLGNRISSKYRTEAAIGYEHDKANRMTKLANLTQGYDKAGNLTLAYSADRASTYKYAYDHNNRLAGVYDSSGVTRKAAFTWDALGRRIEFVNDVLAGTPTTRYYYDGVNEVAEYDGSGNRSRTYVHGISYVDERLMMHSDQTSRPYYYALDRMYDVVMLIDRAGAIVERYCYDAYGRPYIRESCGRGDMDDNTVMNSTDTSRFTAARNGSIWDPRADMDDDGDVDAADQTLYDAKVLIWPPTAAFGPTVAQAFSDVGNPYMFQGVPHFALDTAASATAGKLMLNHHRARFEDVAIGRWLTRDPREYGGGALQPRCPSDLWLEELGQQAHGVDDGAACFPGRRKASAATTLTNSDQARSRVSTATPLFEYSHSAPMSTFDPTGLRPACKSRTSTSCCSACSLDNCLVWPWSEDCCCGYCFVCNGYAGFFFVISCP